MSQINHYVFQNGHLNSIPPEDLELETSTPSFSRLTLVDQQNQAHQREIQALRAEYQAKLQTYQARIKALEKQLSERDHLGSHRHDRRFTTLYDSKTYEQATTLTVDANSICHSFNLRSVEARDMREGLCEINSQFFINRSSMASSEKNPSSKMNESNYLNASEIVNNESQLSSSRANSFSGYSNLLRRLDRSSELVNNISKIVQMDSVRKQVSIIDSRISEQSGYQSFSEQVLNKHGDIVKLLKNLQLERQKQIREMKQHYEELLMQSLSGNQKDKIVRIEPWSHRKNWTDLLRSSKHKGKTQEDEKIDEESKEHNLSLLCFDDQY